LRARLQVRVEEEPPQDRIVGDNDYKIEAAKVARTFTLMPSLHPGIDPFWIEILTRFRADSSGQPPEGTTLAFAFYQLNSQDFAEQDMKRVWARTAVANLRAREYAVRGLVARKSKSIGDAESNFTTAKRMVNEMRDGWQTGKNRSEWWLIAETELLLKTAR
jgi:hypothetical protein